MTVRIVHKSSHPDFIPFPQWFDQRLATAELENNTAEIQKITAAKNAMAAKSMPAVNSLNEVVGDDGKEFVIVKDATEADLVNPDNIVAEMYEYAEMWKNEFNVTMIQKDI